ncbi:MAG: prepilin-type N-terminal cleavage/methylation domain-containing protein [Pontixanthobacter sp.]
MRGEARIGGGGESGFTLVELLVSLLLFALISLAGVGLVETIIGVQQRTENRAERLSEIERALYLLSADIEQLSTGPLVDGGTLLFTRGSAAGDYPVSYRYAGGALYRAVDSRELPVVNGVSGMQLRFFKNGAWTQTPLTEEDPARPSALELTMQLAPRPGTTAGSVRRVIELPDEREPGEP